MISIEDDPKILDARLDSAARARGMTPEQTIVLKRGAAAWYFAWPCRGDTRKLREGIGGATELMASARPEIPFEAAFLEMVAVFVATDFGRPTASNCQRALELANSQP
jgi:hypothetical protein